MGTHGGTQASVLHCLPLVKKSEQRLELEHRHVGEEDRVCVRGTLDRGADLGPAWKREHGIEDEGVLGQEVPVDTEKAVLDLHRYRNAVAKVSDDDRLMVGHRPGTPSFHP